MAADLGPYAGDVAGLVGYHRSPHGAMVHDDAIAAIIGHYNLKIVGEVQLIPADVWDRALYVPPTCGLEPTWRDPTIYETNGNRMISAALAVAGAVLAIAAYSALLVAISKGWI